MFLRVHGVLFVPIRTKRSMRTALYAPSAASSIIVNYLGVRVALLPVKELSQLTKGPAGPRSIDIEAK